MFGDSEGELKKWGKGKFGNMKGEVKKAKQMVPDVIGCGGGGANSKSAQVNLEQVLEREETYWRMRAQTR